MRKKSKAACIELLESRQLLSDVPAFSHVVIVVFENRGYADIIGNPDAAYINSLAAQGASFTDSHGVARPSQPNYIALFSGSTQGVMDDDGPVSFAGPDLASELENSGNTFSGYSEELPVVGSQALTYQDYAKKHNPWSDFTDVPATDNQPYSSFPTDYNTLATVSFVIPDLDDDMHDGTIAEGDQWLATNMGGYAAWAQTHNSLLIVTFDEDSGDDAVDQIPTIFTGAGVKPGNYNENINDYNVLSTIEASTGIAPLGNSATAPAITDVWGSGSGTFGPSPTFLSTLAWSSATVGYGTIQKNASINGNPITLRGAVYPSGIGTHAVSAITYNLAGQYNEFSSDVGVDDEVTAEGGVGSVDFQVLGDGKTLYDSGVLTNKSAAAHIDVSVAGVQQLTLVANNGVANSIDYDHADWAGAQLTPIGAPITAPSAPSNLTAHAASQSEIDLAWQNNAINQTGFQISRAAPGGSFTLLASVGASARSYSDTALSAGAEYQYRVVAINSAGISAASNIADTTTLATNEVQVMLSTLTWASATIGYGTIQKNATINGKPLMLRGTTYASGIGTHAASKIVYNIGGAYTDFISDVGVDDEETGQGSVDFQVLGDGKVLADSGILTGTAPVFHFDVNVKGVAQLTLVANNGVPGSIDYDHADWAGAQLLGVPAVPTPPATLTAAAISASEIDLAWSNTGVGQTGVEIDRSTDGSNFTFLADTVGTATSYNDITLAAGKQYFYRVLAINGVGTSQPSNTASATTFATNPTTTNLSALTWTSATVGYGTIQKNKSINGNTITLRNKTYSTGIGTHAASQIVYNLAGQYTSFISDVGVDDEVSESGSIIFQVIGDGKTLFSSGILTSASPAVSINVDTTGVKQLTLIATNGVAGNIDYDHADWAGAHLLGSPGVPAAPSNLVATPVSTSQIALTWNNNASNQTGFEIDRSSDGTTFAPLATAASTSTSLTDVTASASMKYYYRVLATNSAGPSTPSNIASATTLPAGAVVTYLSDLTATSSTVGYGTIRKDASINNNPITLRGVVYAKGIGTHAVSNITYNVAGKYTMFLADVGVDDEVSGQGSVDFQVIADGVVVFDSGVVTGSSPVVHISLNVAGVKTLSLVATNGIANSIDYDHADWAGARVV